MRKYIHVVFDKKMKYILYLNVAGKYIGGFVKEKGILAHLWTINNGKKWNYEVFENYAWDSARGYGNNHVYLITHVRFKEGIEDGTYLAIGEIKE